MSKHIINKRGTSRFFIGEISTWSGNTFNAVYANDAKDAMQKFIDSNESYVRETAYEVVDGKGNSTVFDISKENDNEDD